VALSSNDGGIYTGEEVGNASLFLSFILSIFWPGYVCRSLLVVRRQLSVKIE
jgi:hypothetical protein